MAAGTSKNFGVRRGPSAGRRLSFEPLEDRRMLAIFTVTSLDDSAVAMPGDAPGTLRQAIFDANNLPGPDVIEFDNALNGAVNLSSIDDTEVGASAFLITSEITIRGNASGITLQRDSSTADMRLFRVAASGRLTLESIMLTGGVARGANGAVPGEEGVAGRGGAVFNQGTLEVVASTLFNNQAIGGNATGAAGGRGLGGAIANDGGAVTIKNATLSANAATSGTGNMVTASFGGAIYTANGILTIHNSTITNNTASSGRGVYIISAAGSATAEIHSSIIAQQDAPEFSRDFVALEDTGGALSVSGSRNLIRTHNVSYPEFTILDPGDPLLAPLANNGGPTLTHQLPSGSQAIDQGNNLLNLATDQRGATHLRVAGDDADIGAYEVQLIAPPALPGDYNRDQVVDAADYVLWRKTMGTVVEMFSGADGSGNSVVDPDDYDVWTANFAATSPGGAASDQPAEQPASAMIATDVSPGTSTAVIDQSTKRGDSSTTQSSAVFDRLVTIRLRLAAFASNPSNVARENAALTLFRNTPRPADRAHDEALLALLADRDQVARPEFSKDLTAGVARDESGQLAAAESANPRPLNNGLALSHHSIATRYRFTL